MANRALEYTAHNGNALLQSIKISGCGAKMLRHDAAMQHFFPRTRTALRVAFGPVGNRMAVWLMEPPSGRNPPSGFRRSIAQSGV